MDLNRPLRIAFFYELYPYRALLRIEEKAGIPLPLRELVPVHQALAQSQSSIGSDTHPLCIGASHSEEWLKIELSFRHKFLFLREIIGIYIAQSIYISIYRVYVRHIFTVCAYFSQHVGWQPE